MKNLNLSINLKLCLVVLGLSFTSYGQKSKKTIDSTFVSETEFKDFISIPPMDYESKVVIFNPGTKEFDTLTIKELSCDKDLIYSFLPNEAVYTTIESNKTNGEIKYGPVAITAKAGSYTVILDYAKFTTLQIGTGNNCGGFARVGVGLRIKAKIVTFETGIDVSSLMSLAAAASKGKIKGQLSIEVIGMESKQITDLITLPVDISEASIQTVLQSLSAIKSKMYDKETHLCPQVLAVKKTNKCTVLNFLNAMQSPPSSMINPFLQDQLFMGKENFPEEKKL